ncbi:MAG: SprT family zinc-dependent metalloprotease [Pseudomonadota bacterium]
MTDLIHLQDPPIAVRLRVLPQARRFTLRLGAPGEPAHLTLPPGVPLAEAEAFLTRQAGWLTRALDRQPTPILVTSGTILPVDGRPMRIEAQLGACSRRHAVEIEGDRLLLPGSGAVGPRIAAWLKARARDAMVPRVQHHAAMLGRKLAGVSLKDTRSRWGSCSSRGRVNLSWRLAMAPPEVQAYLAAHEAAHLVEMNHSERFWRVVAKLMPDYDAPRRWLRTEGRGLHRYRFEGDQPSSTQAMSSAICSGG